MVSVDPSYAPLYSGGFVPISSIEAAFVETCQSPQRRRLASALGLFIEIMRRMGVAGELWIDGSFATHNPTPADVDIALVASMIALSSMTTDDQEQLRYFVSKEGRPYVRQKWNCDVFLVDASSFEERQYWRDRFSKDPVSGGTKGIPVFKL